jgi:Icc-related predicted phosphoesterase
MRIVGLSDTHDKYEQVIVPEGDILVCAGNITREGELDELIGFNQWLGKLSHQHKIVIAGNHDHCFQRHEAEARKILTKAIYLIDDAMVIDGIKFYGSPWQPRFHDFAFNLDRGAQIMEKWKSIPDDTDILITSTPPWGHGDLTRDGYFVGCKELMTRVEEIQPRLHIFGLISEDYGISFNSKSAFLNVSVCDRHYRLINKPQTFDL